MTTQTTADELETLEIQSLLEAVYSRFGYDFRDYALASLRRRIWNVVLAEGVATISGLQEKLLHDSRCLERFLLTISVNVTSLFRDPGFFLLLRQRVVPVLRTYPFIRIWHAGCSTGEEVYSMAMLLQEEGLYDRCRIYATDMDEGVLRQAREGIFSLKQLDEYQENYRAAGGTRKLSDYYTAAYGSAMFRAHLKENVVFSQHNLSVDGSFNEFNLILCRNVMIYFNRRLQGRVHDLLYDSLAVFGVLGLGSKESLRFTSHEHDYETLECGWKLLPPDSVMAHCVVVVGTSMGGLAALERVLAALPACFPCPLAVVQHRSKQSGETLARTLQRHTDLTVKDASDKERLAPGHVYLAPPDYHLLVDGEQFALSTEGPVIHARPSIDVLFESAAFAFGSRTVGVILTGASRDGARGAAKIKERGGYLVVQAPETAESPVMPEAALAAAPADQILPVEEIGPFLAAFLAGGVRQ